MYNKELGKILARVAADLLRPWGGGMETFPSPLSERLCCSTYIEVMAVWGNALNKGKEEDHNMCSMTRREAPRGK